MQARIAPAMKQNLNWVPPDVARQHFGGARHEVAAHEIRIEVSSQQGNPQYWMTHSEPGLLPSAPARRWLATGATVASVRARSSVVRAGDS